MGITTLGSTVLALVLMNTVHRMPKDLMQWYTSFVRRWYIMKLPIILLLIGCFALAAAMAVHVKENFGMYPAVVMSVSFFGVGLPILCIYRCIVQESQRQMMKKYGAHVSQ